MFSLARYVVFGLLSIAVGPIFIWVSTFGDSDYRGIAVGLVLIWLGIYFLYTARQRWREWQEMGKT